MPDILARIMPIFGIIVMVGICLLFSTNRKAALKRWDLFLWGFGLQVIFALLVLKTTAGEMFFDWFNDAFIAIINVTIEGASFVFGPLAEPFGTPSNLATKAYVQEMSAGTYEGFYGTFFFAFNVLPTIIFFSALTSILYHLGILQLVVKGVAWVMMRTMRTSGAETLSASGNIFVGQTEAPLMVRPFINKMTNSELMTVMTGGFATVAGGVLAGYVAMLKDDVPGIAGHLLAASIMSAPAALLFGKIFVPETEEPETLKTLDIEVEKETANVLDAATVGTTEGIRLAINVGGMLIAFLALIAMIDLLLVSSVGLFTDELPAWFNLRGLVGFIFSPLAYLMGVTDWNEALQVGQLMGIKLIANEFVAYGDLAMMLQDPNGPVLSDRARIISTYALCGFANFGSIGIQIGGLTVMAPERRVDLSRLAVRAMFAGTFAANSTACMAAIML